MSLKNTQTSYGSIAKFFHWAIFLLIAGLLTVGFIMTDMDNTPDKFRLYGLHKSIGITVLTLAVLRLSWRVVNVVPVLPASMRNIEKLAAHISHWLLYALIIAMPISGWLMSSASGFSVSVFGFFTLPDLIAPDKALADMLEDAHELIAFAIIALVALHVCAALLHHFYHRNTILSRMLPFGWGKNDA